MLFNIYFLKIAEMSNSVSDETRQNLLYGCVEYQLIKLIRNVSITITS